MARFGFAVKMLRTRFQAVRSLCPYCSSRAFRVIQRKKLLIQARKCEYCDLIYRWPTDGGVENQLFYTNTYYKVEKSIAPPPVEQLAALVQNKFINSPWNKEGRISFIRKRINPTGKLLDFGCSWGYGTFQYQQLGFNKVVGFELDKKRARFGNDQLDLDIKSRWEEMEDREDCGLILADHVLEHVSNPRNVLENFSVHCKSGGNLIVFVPNAACFEARRLGVRWGPFPGEVHPLAFTAEWFLKNLPRHGFSPKFFTSQGEPLPCGEYLPESEEIALIATKFWGPLH